MKDEYKTIEANNISLILNEDMAMKLLYQLCFDFEWVGTIYTPTDIREAIISRRECDDKEPYTEDELEAAVDKVKATRAWRKFMEEWMSEQGYEVMSEIIFDEIEYPEEKKGN